MSAVAGRMSIHVGAYYLQKSNGGRGVLLSGVPGVPPADVVIIGGGRRRHQRRQDRGGDGRRRDDPRDVAGPDARARRHLPRTHQDDRLERPHARGGMPSADLLIGAVLVPGAAAPKLVSRDLISQMKKGAVAVDVAVDQGGCFETTKATTHSDPIYTVDGVIHYCVANMPGAVARTFDLRPDQLDPALRPAARQQGPEEGRRGRPPSGRGPQHVRREADVQGRGRCPGAAVHAPDAGARLLDPIRGNLFPGPAYLGAGGGP